MLLMQKAVNTHAANTHVSKCPSICSNRAVNLICIYTAWHALYYSNIEHSPKATIKTYITEHFT